MLFICPYKTWCVGAWPITSRNGEILAFEAKRPCGVWGFCRSCFGAARQVGPQQARFGLPSGLRSAWAWLFSFPLAVLSLCCCTYLFLTGMMFSKAPGLCVWTAVINLELHTDKCSQGKVWITVTSQLQTGGALACRLFGRWWVWCIFFPLQDVSEFFSCPVPYRAKGGLQCKILLLEYCVLSGTSFSVVKW